LWQSSKRSNHMDLIPKLPPGRSNRKALAFNAEIHRLRAVGYTFEAVRLALRDAGVEVSRTTIKREAAKMSEAVPTAWQPPSSRPQSPAASATSASSFTHATAEASQVPAPIVSAARTSKELAEAFFDAHPSNPLFQTKEMP
jgi:hypothetical protein